ERVHAVVMSLGRSRQHVVNKGSREIPTLPSSLHRILDENGIEIRHREAFDLLLNDPARKCIATADLKNILAAGQHLGRELVARKGECEPLRIVMPSLIHHQAELRPSVKLGHIEKAIVLSLAG